MMAHSLTVLVASAEQPDRLRSWPSSEGKHLGRTGGPSISSRSFFQDLAASGTCSIFLLGRNGYHIRSGADRMQRKGDNIFPIKCKSPQRPHHDPATGGSTECLWEWVTVAGNWKLGTHLIPMTNQCSSCELPSSKSGHRMVSGLSSCLSHCVRKPACHMQSMSQQVRETKGVSQRPPG